MKHGHPYKKLVGELPRLPNRLSWDWRSGGNLLIINETPEVRTIGRVLISPWPRQLLKIWRLDNGVWNSSCYLEGNPEFPKYDDFRDLVGHFVAYWRMTK